jgi:hypothetical protein
MTILPSGEGRGKESQFLRQAKQLLRLFRGRQDHIAIAQGNGFAPGVLEAPLSPERLAEEHLGSSRCLGFYLMLAGDKVSHVWIFFKRPLPAWMVRAFWRGLLKTLKIPVPELYPRQDEMTGKGPGNLVRYPLWNQSHFADVADRWKRLPPCKALSAVSLVSSKQIKRMAATIGFDLTPSAQQQGTARGLGQGVIEKAQSSRRPAHDRPSCKKEHHHEQDENS